MDEVNFQTDGRLNWRDYASDSSLRPGGYRLQGGDVVTATVVLSAQGVGLNTTAHGRISLRTSALTAPTPTTTTLLPAPEQSVIILPGEEEAVTFAFTIPEGLDTRVLRGATFEVAVRGVNVAAGYINQQGGSTVTIPWVLEETVAGL
ncbi:hypothetical protein BH23ACT9_BH23ACT9_13630 [soil metagenome]